MEKDPDTTVKHDVFPFVKIYESGRIERRMGTKTVPAGTDPATGVTSKDIQINPSTGVFARLYLPPNLSANTKLPLVVYIHGGAFVIESAASPTYQNYLNTLVSKANILVVSVDYRRAPEHPLPAANDDCWEVLTWAANGSCPDEWVSTYGDLGRLYLAGDSAGGTLAHHMAVKAASEGIKIKGLLLFHPWFGGGEPFGSESEDPVRREKNLKNWRLIYPESPGLDDHFMNPMVTEGGMDGVYKCEKVVVEVAQKDELKHRGKLYYDKLEEAVSSGKWDGHLEFYEVDNEHHVFFLRNSNRETEVDMMQRVVNFID